MNMARTSGGAAPRPPDRGSFPLDHFAECRPQMDAYMNCLKNNNMDAQAEECRKLSGAYFQCRMEKGLMAEDSLKALGIELNDEGEE